MLLTYKFTESDQGIAVTVFYQMRNYTYTTESHTDFYGLVEALRKYSEAFVSKLDLQSMVDKVVDFLRPEYFQKITSGIDELEFRDGTVYFGDTPLTGVLVDRIITFKEKNLPYEPYWNFLRKVMTNPDPRSREQLYTFLENNDFPPITMDGDFLAYKGLNLDWTSINKGYGIVDGKVYEHAALPNHIGSVITMPRHKVNSDPSQGCSFGLHVGSLEYVKDFARGRMVIVKVNPRDVVSVPQDSSFQKVRTCQYEVVGEFTEKLTEVVSSTFSGVTPLRDTMEKLNDDTIQNEYHLANRTVNKLHPEAAHNERKAYMDEYLSVAREVFGSKEPSSEDETTSDPGSTHIVAHIVLNTMTEDLLPISNVWHLAGRIANKAHGAGTWNTSQEKYRDILEGVKAIYAALDKDEYDNLTWYDYQKALPKLKGFNPTISIPF